MRQIKASEVKPGMEVEFTLTRRMKIRNVITWDDSHRELRDDTGYVARVDADAPVTVVSEPRPEEPTELGVKARVRKGRFVRLHEGLAGSNVWFEEGTGYRWTWDDLCDMGPVTVIPDQGWTVPDTPEVPDRIEEWPEGDTALRKHEWRDSSGRFWQSLGEGDWRFEVGPDTWSFSYPRPYRGPWTRETDA